MCFMNIYIYSNIYTILLLYTNISAHMCVNISTFYICVSMVRIQESKMDSMTENEILRNGGREGNITYVIICDIKVDREVLG